MFFLNIDAHHLLEIFYSAQDNRQGMKYASKLLLFGEHTVLKGSQALAMPFPRFFGQWRYNNAVDQRLVAFAAYLQEAYFQRELKLADFKTDLYRGLYFDSNIPIGYGLGSSGALCAALYDVYAYQKIPTTDAARFQEIRNILAQMERFFHGASSGTDPLISYLRQPVLIHPHGQIAAVSLPGFSPDFTLFLLDTGIARQASEWIHFFSEKCKDTATGKAVDEALVPAVNDAIQAFLAANWIACSDAIVRISHLQFTHFREMITLPFQKLWQQGLDTALFSLKLCGAGGGGFILGCTQDWQSFQALLKSNGIEAYLRINSTD